MFAGLDFGTSNSAIGVVLDCQSKLLNLQQGSPYVPSTVFTFDRNLIADFICRTASVDTAYKESRKLQLAGARSFKLEMGYDNSDQLQFFGDAAIQHYIETPEDGVYIKSPKSFLGSTGLNQHQLHFIEDLVTAMVINIKSKAESNLSDALTHSVVGRPVNYQGVNSESSNQQAIQIMDSALTRAGFKSVEYLYEPLAAGIDFETSLKEDCTVLVVDIGGGTTDCSMVRMGPSYVNKVERREDFLAHTGQRVGGNDLDIHLAFKSFMPAFGLGSSQKKGIEMPKAPFWNAVSINNVGDQSVFNSDRLYRDLLDLKRDATQPDLIQRLIKLQQTKQNHRLVRDSELTKIGLSDNDPAEVDLTYIDEDLLFSISGEDFESSIATPIEKIKALISDAVIQAGEEPEIIYVTGGSAKSPILRSAILSVLPEAKLLDGDYFGSVASGLTKWAERIWK